MMDSETLEVSSKQLPYFRTSEFSEIMLDSERILKKLLRTADDSKIAFLTASGSGAMDAAVSEIFTRNDKLLVVNGGSFGRRFCEICEFHEIEHEEIKLAFGEILTVEHLVKYDGKGFTGFLVNIDETSVGQLYDIKIISEFCKRNGLVLIVDAISSFLADPLDMDGYEIDAVILSSQKAMALSPGISAVVLNNKTYESRILKNKPASYYLSLRSHIENQKRGQTPFTPAVGVLLELNEKLNRIEKIGLDKWIENIRELSEYFRNKAREAGIEIPSFPLSNAVTPICVHGQAQTIFRRLWDEYQIYITPSGGDLKDDLLRVGHLGNLHKQDYDDLIKALKEILQ